MAVKKIWHDYRKWEDFAAGMWRRVGGQERQEFMARAIEFTGDHKLYGQFMRRVVAEWPVASEHNLTDTGSNRRAWVGHAACCLAINCPEDITRQAWGHLTQRQQDDANHEASLSIALWEGRFETENTQLCFDLEGERVSP